MEQNGGGTSPAEHCSQQPPCPLQSWSQLPQEEHMKVKDGFNPGLALPSLRQV